MNSKELLESLEYVGNDLIGDADQTIRVRKPRPWATAAAAAGLIAALALGGFTLWRTLQNRSAPSASGTDAAGTVSETGAVSETRPVSSTPDLPLLTVGDGWPLIYLREFDDIEASLRYAGDGEGIEALPVYVNSWEEEDPEAAPENPLYYNRPQLHARLRAAAAFFGAALPEEDNINEADYSWPADMPGELRAETDLGTLVASGDGSVCLLFNEANVIHATVKVQLAGGLTEEETARVLRNLMMEDCARKIRERFGLPECLLEPCPQWNSLSSGWHAYTLYPRREDPAAQVWSRCLGALRLLTGNGHDVQGIALNPGFLEAAVDLSDYGIDSHLVLAGTYPIISLEEARAQALAGNYLYQVDGGGMVGLTAEDLALAELIYPDTRQRTLMPYYRFWIAQGEGLYAAIYVPAVDPAYLSNWSGTPAEPSTEPTEQAAPSDRPTYPCPVLLEDGRWGVQGPAGTVEALSYMGGDWRDSVQADVDGDGETELVYWCGGPTSGLFTIGICVYGLEEGWPVLEAAQFYSLTWGEISLSVSEGRVLLHYRLHRFDQAVGTTVPQAEQVCAVTVWKGQVLLNGGELPEGCALWGGSEWTLFGSSFEALKAEVRERCLLNHWECLVWVDPTDLIEGASSPVYAAVTDNCTTVTGLLRWSLQKDGTWFWTGQGMEPIETPEDPEALAELTMEELVQKLGPWHFDLGSGLYIPCWFTQDCQLLMVWPGSYVRLTPLTELTSDN